MARDGRETVSKRFREARWVSALAAMFLLAWSLASCSADATGILIEVTSSDLAVGTDIDSLEFSAVTYGGARVSQSYPISGTWPHSLTLVPPTTDRTDGVTITVIGRLREMFVVRRVVDATFQSGSTRPVSVELTEACRGVMCVDPGADCRAGMCSVGGQADAGVDSGLESDSGTLTKPTDRLDGSLFDSAAELADSGESDSATTPPTPDASSSSPDSGAPIRCGDNPTACHGMLVISEFATGSEVSAGDEFVELYNRTGNTLDLAGVHLDYQAHPAANAVAIVNGFPAPSTIAPHSFYLVGNGSYSGSVAADLDGSASGFGATRGSIVLYVDRTMPLDLVGWHTADQEPAAEGAYIADPQPTSGSYERKASSTATATSMSSTEAMSGNGYDSDNNATDFVLRPMRDPQSSMSAAETPPT